MKIILFLLMGLNDLAIGEGPTPIFLEDLEPGVNCLEKTDSLRAGGRFKDLPKNLSDMYNNSSISRYKHEAANGWCGRMRSCQNQIDGKCLMPVPVPVGQKCNAGRNSSTKAKTGETIMYEGLCKAVNPAVLPKGQEQPWTKNGQKYYLCLCDLKEVKVPRAMVSILVGQNGEKIEKPEVEKCENGLEETLPTHNSRFKLKMMDKTMTELENPNFYKN